MTSPNQPPLARHVVAIGLALGCGLAVAGVLLAGHFAAANAGDNKNQALPYGEVNWSRGFVKVSAMGLPAFGGTGGTKAEESARQNAVSAAQKRLLGVLLGLEGRNGKLRDALVGRPELKERLRQLVSSAVVKGKTYADGSVEVTLTVATEGHNGLKALLREI